VLAVHLQAHVDEGVERDVVELAVGAAQVDGDGPLFGLLVAQDDDIGGLEVLVVFDLLLHVLVGVVGLEADAVGGQSAGDLLGVVIVLQTDRDDSDLIGGEPEGEGALEVLDQDADKALEGSEEGAVDVSSKLRGSWKSSWTVPHCHSRPRASLICRSILGP